MGFKEKNIIDDTLKLCKTNQSLKGSIKNSKLGQKVYTTTPSIEHSSCNSEVGLLEVLADNCTDSAIIFKVLSGAKSNT